MPSLPQLARHWNARELTSGWLSSSLCKMGAWNLTHDVFHSCKAFLGQDLEGIRWKTCGCDKHYTLPVPQVCMKAVNKHHWTHTTCRWDCANWCPRPILESGRQTAFDIGDSRLTAVAHQIQLLAQISELTGFRQVHISNSSHLTQVARRLGLLNFGVHAQFA